MTSDLCLVSGGVDSTIMAMQYPQATRVFIDFGQPYAEREKEALNRLFGSTYQTITVRNKLDKESELSDIFIPSRNLFLATLVVVKFKPDRVLIAGLGDDYVVDKNPDAFEHMSEILTRFSGKPITVYSPYFGFTKGSLVESFLESSSDKNEARVTLENTYSCYSGGEKPCMDCPACFRKFVALASNGIFNKQSIPSDRIIKEYLLKLHTYNPERISRTLTALKYLRDVLAVDIDGILCEEKGRYSDRIPYTENIEKLRRFDGYIVLFTARYENDRKHTETWLKQHNVRYDALLMSKIPYTRLIDDKAASAFDGSINIETKKTRFSFATEEGR